jgi:hypothetical protein
VETESFWENTSASDLRQGDYIVDCPVPFFAEIPAERLKVVPQVIVYDLIVITQSCDLINAKAEFVAMCPVYPLKNYEIINPEFARKGRWEEVRKGRIEGLYLLSSPTNPANNRECLVVDFREIYSLPFAFLTKHAESLESRRRLRSPYLEHFSQAFARFFMRVGLPANIPPFK